MITSARIREDVSEAQGLNWITALRATSIQKLAYRSGEAVPTLFKFGRVMVYPSQYARVCQIDAAARPSWPPNRGSST
jgi:hypothetical protein